MDPKEIGRLLAEPFPPDVVSWKPQSVKGNRALAVAYVSARDVMDRLDDVLGVGGWSDHYDIRESGSVLCTLRVKVGGEWVTKCDIGSPSEQPDAGDAIKAAVSDALKRAAVKLGVARYLYHLPMTWCDYDAVKKQFVQTPRLPDWALPAKRTPQNATQLTQPPPAPLASAQQVYKIEAMVEEANVGGPEIKKWLDKANATEWAEMTAAQVQACIDECNRRVAERGRK